MCGTETYPFLFLKGATVLKLKQIKKKKMNHEISIQLKYFQIIHQQIGSKTNNPLENNS